VLSFLVVIASVPRLIPAADPPGPQVPFGPKQRAIIKKLHVEEAWKVTRGDPKVVVGVIDSGFDYFHPALEGQVDPGLYYSEGYHPEIYTNLAHGTMVLGLIVAQPRGPDPVSGLAPCCRALTASWGTLESPVVKLRAEFLRRHPEATPQEVQRELIRHQDTLQQWGRRWAVYQVAGAAGAIRYFVDHGCRVINISGLLLK
jgi:subtilisin family serine protease